MTARRRHSSHLASLTLMLLAESALGDEGASSTTARPSDAALARPCLACHGSANTGVIPEIRGMQKERLSARLREFRDVLKLSVMHRIARGYSDEDYARLGTYFQDLPHEAR